jgi:hypothetical protein
VVAAAPHDCQHHQARGDKLSAIFYMKIPEPRFPKWKVMKCSGVLQYVFFLSLGHACIPIGKILNCPKDII